MSNLLRVWVLFIVLATMVSCVGSRSIATVARQPERAAAGTLTAIDVSRDDFATSPHVSRTIELKHPGVLQLSLYSSPTTGYAWSEASITELGMLQQESRRYVPPPTSAVGAGGQEVWRFRSAGQGQATISMEYRQPWEGGEKGWTFEINVSVR